MNGARWFSLEPVWVVVPTVGVARPLCCLVYSELIAVESKIAE